MKSEDLKALRKYRLRETSTATITLAKGEGALGENLWQFCQELEQLAPSVTIKRTGDIAFEPPVMVVGRHNNIAYHAVPRAKILPLFLETLDQPSPDGNRISNESEALLKQIDLPADLKLYVSGQCPHCPQSIGRLQALAVRNPAIRLKIIDVEFFPEQSEADQVRSVPTLIMDEQFRWTGQVDSEEVLAICANRDASQLSANSLRQLIEDGDAQRVAAMMAESDRIFPALIELATHQRWSVRLGAMVTAEYLVDASPGLAVQLCKLLWDRFPKLQPSVQGDVIHLFGLVGQATASGYLQAIAEGEYDPEAKEAAVEVLAEMEG